ncbi:MAG TPA: retropepsin-like aspartic protease, partial [Ktedonobacterales bacterium]|nr:retropepsin-like aspartic protease [Ktedonobacterales bacterium]
CLALAGCELTIGDGNVGQTTSTGSTTTVKVKILKGQGGATLIQAPVTIDNKGPYNFILDTGASISVVDTELADMLALPVVGAGQPVSGVGGKETAIPIKVTTWKLGDLKLPSATITKGNLPESEHGQGLQGLLGSDILSRFGRITIDYSGSSITVYRQASADVPGSGPFGGLFGGVFDAARRVA